MGGVGWGGRVQSRFLNGGSEQKPPQLLDTQHLAGGCWVVLEGSSPVKGFHVRPTGAPESPTCRLLKPHVKQCPAPGSLAPNEAQPVGLRDPHLWGHPFTLLLGGQARQWP